jgi:hypothetical protein
MLTKKASLIFIVISIAILASCGKQQRVTKGDVYQRINKDIDIGATKSDVTKYLEQLEINGIKPIRHDSYTREQLNFTVIAPNGESVKVEGMIFAVFRSKGFELLNFCPSVGVIFYFDKSDKLINSNIDCFRQEGSADAPTPNNSLNRSANSTAFMRETCIISAVRRARLIRALGPSLKL